MKEFNPAKFRPLLDQLNGHPVYSSLRTMEDLRLFMSCHVFSVWDFMSLVKFLQKQIAPHDFPWRPHGTGSVRRFINSLVLEEESDEGMPDPDGRVTQFASHFELYCLAMKEVGGSPSQILDFVESTATGGIDQALLMPGIPEPSRTFVQKTFGFIRNQKAHEVAAALAMGREHIIPGMFRTFLAKMGIQEADAPVFYYYLKRHIHLDEDFHGPLSLQLLNELCGGDEVRVGEAERAAEAAILARIHFWDGVGGLIRDRQTVQG